MSVGEALLVIFNVVDTDRKSTVAALIQLTYHRRNNNIWFIG